MASHQERSRLQQDWDLKEELMGFLPKKTYFFPLTQDMLMIHHTSIAVALSATIGLSSLWTFSAAIGSWGF